MSTQLGRALRRLYLVRAAFAVVWAVVLIATATSVGPLLTVLLVVYPLFDAAAVLWQLRANPDADASRVSEWVSVVVSVAVALALAVASTASIGAVLVVWGVWAVVAGIPQLVTAIRNRRSGGQVAQMLSGGLSVLVGGGILVQGLQGSEMIAAVGGYAIGGAVFFLASAIRLGILLGRDATA